MNSNSKVPSIPLLHRASTTELPREKRDGYFESPERMCKVRLAPRKQKVQPSETSASSAIFRSITARDLVSEAVYEDSAPGGHQRFCGIGSRVSAGSGFSTPTYIGAPYPSSDLILLTPSIGNKPDQRRFRLKPRAPCQGGYDAPSSALNMMLAAEQSTPPSTKFRATEASFATLTATSSLVTFVHSRNTKRENRDTTRDSETLTGREEPGDCSCTTPVLSTKTN